MGFLEPTRWAIDTTTSYLAPSNLRNSVLVRLILASVHTSLLSYLEDGRAVSLLIHGFVRYLRPKGIMIDALRTLLRLLLLELCRC